MLPLYSTDELSNTEFTVDFVSLRESSGNKYILIFHEFKCLPISIFEDPINHDDWHKSVFHFTKNYVCK